MHITTEKKKKKKKYKDAEGDYINLIYPPVPPSAPARHSKGTITKT